MHVASTMVFEGPAPAYDEFTRPHRSRGCTWSRASARSCASCPSARAGPVWVDDPHFNLGYHVRHTALPPPGSEEQLRTLAARALLPAARPLEAALGDVAGRGAEGRPLRARRQDPPRARRRRLGRRHHAPSSSTLDARPAGAARARALGPRARAHRAAAARRGADRARDQPRRDGPRRPRASSARPRQALARGRGRPSARSAPFAGTSMAAPSTPFNVEIGPYRRFAWVERATSTSSRRSRTARGHRQRRRPRRRLGGARPLPARPRASRPAASSCARWSRSASAPPRSTAPWATACRR